MIKVTDKASGFTQANITKMVAQIESIYRSENPPADKIEVLVDELMFADKSHLCYASVRLTKFGKTHVSRSRFKLVAPGVINRKTFMFL